MSIGRLHVITDTHAGRDPLPTVHAALKAGAPVIQVRNKTATDRELYDLVCRVVEMCQKHGARCIVNDRLHVALAATAGGAHVGEHDLPVAAARRVAQRAGFILGATARSPSAAFVAEDGGADYVGVGPAYRTTTKEGLPAPLGPEGVAAVASRVAIPVIAIAGVTVHRVQELLEAGAHGVAVVGAISESDNPARATEELLAAIESSAGARA